MDHSGSNLAKLRPTSHQFQSGVSNVLNNADVWGWLIQQDDTLPQERAGVIDCLPPVSHTEMCMLFHILGDLSMLEYMHSIAPPSVVLQLVAKLNKATWLMLYIDFHSFV